MTRQIISNETLKYKKKKLNSILVFLIKRILYFTRTEIIFVKNQQFKRVCNVVYLKISLKKKPCLIKNYITLELKNNLKITKKKLKILFLFLLFIYIFFIFFFSYFYFLYFL
jgi:hypothetical protein